jgi:hypothetical protein
VRPCGLRGVAILRHVVDAPLRAGKSPSNQFYGGAYGWRDLAVFHFVGAGLAVFGMLFLLAHYAIMSVVFDNSKMWEGQKDGPPPAEFFAIFKYVYLVAAAWFVTSGVLNVISGLNILARRRRILSLVVAGLNCLYMPLGTALGVFTIIVLLRDSVRDLYETESR